MSGADAGPPTSTAVRRAPEAARGSVPIGVGESPSTGTVLRSVLGSPAQISVLLALAVVVTLLYTLLLPFQFTQRFSLANWGFLTGRLLAWSVVLGVAMAFVLTLQVHAVRQIAAARSGALTGLALIASLLPSFLCCTPIIPTLLAFLGLSTVSIYGTTGALQHFFAVHQTGFLVASLLLLVASGWWALRRVAHAQCLAGQCATPTQMQECC